MRSADWRGSWRRFYLLMLFVFVGGAVASCGPRIDPEEAQVCRAIVGGLTTGFEPVEIVDIRRIAGGIPHLAGQTADAAPGLSVHYTARSPRSGRRHHLLTCRFARGVRGANAMQRLSGVESEIGPFGPARLYMLKRFWLDRLPLESADPDPLWTFRQAPEVHAGIAYALQAVVAGLPQMALLTLLSGAYALIYGLAGRINLAFGEVVLIGSAAGVIGAAEGGSQPVAAIALAAGLALFAAAAWSTSGARLIFARPALRSGQAYLIASVGTLLALSELLRLLRGRHPGATPPFLDQPWPIVRAGRFTVTVTPIALIVTVLALLGSAMLVRFMWRSRFGRRWRAVADDPFAAALLGTDATQLHHQTLGMAGALAGLAGALSVLHYGSAYGASGLLLGLKAIFAAILGGGGAVAGAIVGGILIGLFEALWSAYLPIEHKDAAMLAVLTLLLVLRPGGFASAPELAMHDR